MALALGRTVEELNATLSASEWISWLQFFEVEPYGLPVIDVVQAQLRALIGNIHRNDQARPEPFHVRDFLLFMNEASHEEIQGAPINDGLSASEWQLAMYLRAYQDQQANDA